MKPRLVIFMLGITLLAGTAACTTQPAPTSTIQPTITEITSTPEPTQIPSLTPSPTVTVTVTPTPFPTSFPLSEVEYLLPPTIRYLDENSVTIFFELSQPISGSVFLLAEGSGLLANQQDFGSDETRHMLTFTGLEPAANYRILTAVETDMGMQIPNFEGEDWGTINCKTRSDAYPLRIGMISDASFGDEVTQQLIANMAQADLDFVFHLGDVVDVLEWGVDPFQAYAENYYQSFAPLLKQMPVYTVPGNHDYDADIRYNEEPFYFYAFPPASQMDNRQYTQLAFNDVQFLLLDAMTLWGMPGREAQDAWLVEQLHNDQYRISIPIFHIAPFSSSVVHPEDGAPIRNFWVPLFEEANVPAAFSGHFHHYERLTVNGITYIVAGGGSSVLYAVGEYLPQTEVITRTSHFILLEVYPDTLEITAVDVDGNILDTISVGY